MKLFRGLSQACVWTVLVSLFLLYVATASAQAPTGAVEGSVADGTGVALATARVTLTDRATGTHRELDVASGGRFQFAALPIGDYLLRIESAGFAAYVEEQIHPSVGGAVRVDARLAPATQQETSAFRLLIWHRLTLDVCCRRGRLA